MGVDDIKADDHEVWRQGFVADSRQIRIWDCSRVPACLPCWFSPLHSFFCPSVCPSDTWQTSFYLEILKSNISVYSPNSYEWVLKPSNWTSKLTIWSSLKPVSSPLVTYFALVLSVWNKSFSIPEAYSLIEAGWVGVSKHVPYMVIGFWNETSLMLAC